MIGEDLLQRQLFSKESSIRVLCLGGEQFPPVETLKRWLVDAPVHLRVFNIYGTSEVSSWATIHEVKMTDYHGSCSSDSICGGVPIGDPLSDTVVEVRDAGCCPVNDGVGEIWIGK